MDPRGDVARAVRRQARGCRALGSPLYAGLLDRTAADVERGGPAWHVLEPFAGWNPDAVYALRLMGAVHRRVLTGELPDLAPHFAPGGDAGAAWPAFHAALAGHGDRLRADAEARAVQTNEVGRCAALAPAILWLAGGRPVRLLEIGSSAGLNLRWDAYRYEDLWGDRESPVRLARRYEGDPPPFAPAHAEVAERRGCDVAPLDPRAEDDRLTLRSFVWPDQAERMALLDGALAVAERIPATVDRAPAAAWLAAALAAPAPGCVSVVFHSIVWQYLPDAEREGVRERLAEAGARATPDAALAWLRMEPDGQETRVDATVWPPGRTVRLARAGFHGRPVRWLTTR